MHTNASSLVRVDEELLGLLEARAPRRREDMCGVLRRGRVPILHLTHTDTQQACLHRPSEIVLHELQDILRVLTLAPEEHEVISDYVTIWEHRQQSPGQDLLYLPTSFQARRREHRNPPFRGTLRGYTTFQRLEDVCQSLVVLLRHVVDECRRHSFSPLQRRSCHGSRPKHAPNIFCVDR